MTEGVTVIKEHEHTHSHKKFVAGQRRVFEGPDKMLDYNLELTLTGTLLMS